MNLNDVVVLDEISMMLLRPDTFVGSIEQKTLRTYVFDDVNLNPVFREVTYSPALLKCVDEILQNCYDHSKRPEGQHLNRVDVTINQMTGAISIEDNAGIPVEKHPLADVDPAKYSGYIPCIIFGSLRSSTNYNDSDKREGGGRNGLGSKLTNIFSSMFQVDTCDGKNKYTKTYTNNRRDETEPKISKGTKRGTKISFIPDYKVLGLDDIMSQDNYAMMVTRVYEIAACAPTIDFYLNGKKVDVKGFGDFVEKFGDEYVYAENEHWRIGIHPSNDGFKHVSFCNATHTWQGGTHVDYIANQLVDGVREYVKKKTKQDLKPADIKNHFFLMVDATVYNPRFSSQTKEFMNLQVSSFGTMMKLDDKFMKALLKSSIVADIVEWAVNRKKLQDMADLKRIGQQAAKTSNKMIPKYEPASQKQNRDECILFVCEGESAANPLLSARDPKKHGVFELRGKMLNMANAKLEDIKKNEEIKNLMAALCLEFNNPNTELRYGKIVIATDADFDGMHIRGLFLNNIRHFWPHLLLEGRIYFLSTPILRVTQGKKELEFFSLNEFESWKANQTASYSVKYLKGLGGNSTDKFKKYMFEDKYIIPLEVDEEAFDYIDLAFGDPKDKKVWLNLEQA